jgi:hypothetical protein
MTAFGMLVKACILGVGLYRTDFCIAGVSLLYPFFGENRVWLKFFSVYVNLRELSDAALDEGGGNRGANTFSARYAARNEEGANFAGQSDDDLARFDPAKDTERSGGFTPMSSAPAMDYGVPSGRGRTHNF